MYGGAAALFGFGSYNAYPHYDHPGDDVRPSLNYRRVWMGGAVSVAGPPRYRIVQALKLKLKWKLKLKLKGIWYRVGHLVWVIANHPLNLSIV